MHEDLRITNMVRSGRGTPEARAPTWHRSRGSTDPSTTPGWGQLLAFISYKAEEAGRELVAVDPRNSSLTCSSCGHVAKENRCSQAVFRCTACDHQAHADENAAVNILRAGLARRALREVQKKAA